MPSSMGFMCPWLTCIPSRGRIHMSPGHMKTIARRIRVSMAHMHRVDRHVNSTIVFAAG